MGEFPFIRNVFFGLLAGYHFVIMFLSYYLTQVRQLIFFFKQNRFHTDERLPKFSCDNGLRP